MRVAAIDVGTNTILLLVAERQSDGTFAAIAERATITRLGEGVDGSKRLAPAAVARTCACLRQYAAVVSDCGADRIAVVGTSAMRDAAGGEEVRACVRSAFGVEARVIAGQEEARLTFRGALSGLSLEPDEEVAVFDIGGGSTEVVLGRNEASVQTSRFSQSFDIGSVRLTERHVRHDPPTRAELDSLVRSAAEAFACVPPIGSTPIPPVGVAGTVTTLAAVVLGVTPYQGAQVHGQTIRRKDLESVVHDLGRMDLQVRQSVKGMEPRRADVIVAGGIIALALLEHWGVNSLVVSDRGVRWGLAEELAEQDGP
jgi:exopolyphosphatase / guanosine-5'-triphosphate,3'-diphosphate pyrophosphatase